MIPTRDARHWLDAEVARLKFEGQTWGGGQPYGDLLVPPDGLLLHEPLIFPKNCNPKGPRTSIFDVASFVAADDFVAGDATHQWALSWEKSASQGCFSQHARDMSLDCRGIADGILCTGDQGSCYDSILVEYARETNVLFSGVTHGATARNIWVKGSRESRALNLDEPLRGVGIALRNCSGFQLDGASVHRCKTGLVKVNCSTCPDFTDFEKVILPFEWHNAVNCDSSSHHLLHRAPDGDMGSFTACEMSTVKGTLRLGASVVASAFVNGSRRTVSSQADKNDAKPFIITL